MTESTRSATNRIDISGKTLDLDEFVTASQVQPPALTAPDQVEQADASALAEVGVLLKEQDRSGTYVLRDFNPICVQAQVEGLELLPIAVALEMYDWLHDYRWQAVPADLNEITRRSAADPAPQGYFIRVKQGTKIPHPVQAGLYMAHSGIAQTVQNVIILEDDTELHLITGCVTGRSVQHGVHFAISEAYIGQNATLTNTMVHSWGPQVTVRPHAGTVVEAGGAFISNYVSLRPVGDILSRPKTWLNGEGASAKYLTIILGAAGSEIDTGGEVYLNALDTSAEITHRGVCTGGHMYQGGLLIGNAECRGHVDCSGLLLNPGKEGFIVSVPGIKALHPEAQMSHEASIGKIAPEQVEYLQSRGIEEREAISMIVRGFLEADIEGLGAELDAQIAEIAELAGQAEG